MLRIENLRVKYNQIWALRGVSLEVRAGEIVTLLGPNGAGKSTLLLAISGGIHDVGRGIEVSGDILLDQEQLRGRSAEVVFRRGLSLVPEGHRIFPSLSVRENLTLPLRRAGADGWAAQLDEVLSLFPVLRERLKQTAGKLSGGQQQQLAIAQALVSSPRMLLLDEPSLGLSPQMVEQVFSVLTQLRARGVTLLIVEQRATEALKISDRAYVLRNGAIELDGKSSDVLKSPVFHQAYFGFSKQEGAR